MPALLPFPVVYPFQIPSADPDGDSESARMLSDRIRYVHYYLSLVLGVALDTDITSPLLFNVSLLGSQNQDTRVIDATHVQLNAEVVLTGAPNTVLARHVSPGAISVDIGLAGPAINGRDQAGAFGADTFIHFYWIYNGTTLAGISSLTPPPVGPVLPPGYVLGAYAGALRRTASVILAGGIRGRWTHYTTPVSILTGGTAGGETAVTAATAVPANAVRCRLLASSADGVLTVKSALSATAGQVRSTSPLAPNFVNIEVPMYTSQEVRYLEGGGTANLSVLGFENPNAG